jgi:hypothetical protein
LPDAAQRQTPDIRAIRDSLSRFLNSRDEYGRAIGSATCGVYAFYDYDGEPIYVGQTYERLRGRIGRHLTNQRTDAVAMHVLDPMEVATVEVWPFWDLDGAPRSEKQRTLSRAEYTVYRMLADRATVSQLLNERSPQVAAPLLPLPKSYTGTIVPAELRA